MSKLVKITRWGAAAVLVVAAAWTGFLTYFAYHFVNQWPNDIETLAEKASMATVFTAHYWPLLGAFSFVSFIAAAFLGWRVDAPVPFFLSVAFSALLAALAMNVLVVSTGFELSALAGK